MQGRGRSRMEQRQQGVMRQTQAGLPRTACRRHAGRRWRRIIVACRQGRDLSGRRSREHSKASDKDAGRQNKLQSLPLTRIAGRDSPKPLCIADLSARRQGKSLLRISRRTRTCRPASRGNVWALPARGLTSPCFPLRGDLRSRSAHTQPPARSGVQAPPTVESGSPGVCGGLWWPEGFRGALTSLQAAPWLRAARNDAVLSHLANACVFSMTSARPIRPRWAT